MSKLFNINTLTQDYSIKELKPEYSHKEFDKIRKECGRVKDKYFKEYIKKYDNAFILGKI